MSASIRTAEFFSTLFAPSLISQGGESFSASFTHPSETTVEIEASGPPAPSSLEPLELTADIAGEQVRFDVVIVSHNPSDQTGGIEIAALASDDRYIGLFTEGAVGTHALAQTWPPRHAVLGVQGEVDYEETGVGSVTIDELGPELARGSFEFELSLGSVTGSFTSRIAN